MKISSAFWCLLVVAVLIVSRTVTAAQLLVVGRGSNNIVRFDIETGAASLFANYPGTAHSYPRELAMDAQGQIFSSTELRNRNVVKFVSQPGTDVHTGIDFTSAVGTFGPGQLQFYQGDLFAAGDTLRQILRFNGETGALKQSFSVPSSGNIRGMTIRGDYLYYSEIFQDRIRRMDLTQNPPTGGTLFTDGVHLAEPIDLLVGGNGNLFVTNRDSTLVQEFDIQTGAFMRTFVDLNTFDPHFPGDVGIAYDASLNNYFLSAGNIVYRVDADGNLLQRYQDDMLLLAYGLLVVPEPSTVALAAIGLLALAGVAVRSKVHLAGSR